MDDAKLYELIRKWLLIRVSKSDLPTDFSDINCDICHYIENMPDSQIEYLMDLMIHDLTVELVKRSCLD